jgi:hypothetical protein
MAFHRDDRRALLDRKLTELLLYAKELCPANLVTVSFTYMRSEADRAWRVSYSAHQEWHSGAVPANARYVS